MTGAELGLEARKILRRLPPEFLIFSGYKQTDYYEAALTLDAAAYLVKVEVGQEDVIRHIRSLCLRRALSFEREEIDRKISEIADSSPTPVEAVVNFCRRLLAPEMQACIGIPSIFLLTDDKGTQNCGSDADVPVGYDHAYEKIQALAQGSVNLTEPFVFEMSKVSAPSDEQSYNINLRLNRAAFLPLFVVHGMRLSIGILQPDKTLHLREDPFKLGSILTSYLRPAIIEHLLRILSQLTETNARRKTLIQHTSRFCLWTGQEQLAILEEAKEKGEFDSSKECFQKFKTLSEDLRLTGDFLSRLALKAENERKVETLHAAEIVKEAWREITEQFDAEGIAFEEIGEDVTLPIARGDLLLSTLRVFQWMAQRKDRVPSGNQRISVEYANRNSRAEITFTDQSRRLGERLRAMLFEPFTQANFTPSLPKEKDEEKRPGLYVPLFLARMLVEVKYNGWLLDKTDKLENTQGHSFVMSFPLGVEASVKEDAVVNSQSAFSA